MNDFDHVQTLLYYKEDMNIIQKNRKRFNFRIDGATVLNFKISKHLLDKLFTNKRRIQNPPNSPDVAYPIEDLWGIIKPRIKRKDPSSINKLKNF